MRKYRFMALLSVFWLVVGFVLPTTAYAQSTACPPEESSASGSVTVLERNADITILPDGNVRYVETWVVDFIGSGFRFAFRTIPLNRATDIVDWSVSEGATVYEESSRGEYVYNLSGGGGERTIHWCFPSTSNQTRTFTLSYTVEGSLGIYEDGDRYFWKFIEADRGYTIEESHVLLHLPADVSADQLELAGFINAQENLRVLAPGDGTGVLMGPSNARILDSRTIEFFGGPFYGGDEWEIGARFPHGLVTAEPAFWQYVEDNAAFVALSVLCVSGIFLLAGGLGLYLFWYTLGRDKPAGVRAEFFPHPPADLPPGVAGVLLDESADMEDVTATLVDLARRGYLKISEEDAPGFGKRTDFRFVLLNNNYAALRPYEQRLLKALFPNRGERLLSNMKNKFYTSLPDIYRLMYEETTAQGFFAGSPEKVRQRYGCTGFLLSAVVGLISFAVFGFASGLTSPGIALCLSGSIMVFPVGMLLAARYMPRKTDKGVRAAMQWSAFKRYLENIDKYASVESAKDQFEKYLPYAIAFGVEKSWVKKFTQTDVAVPIWYEPFPMGGGSAARRSVMGRPAEGGAAAPGGGVPSLDDAAGRVFGGLESMSTGLFTMLDQAASTFTSAPSSSGSGGGGGGGFSGGGGGGGGSSGFG